MKFVKAFRRFLESKIGSKSALRQRSGAGVVLGKLVVQIGRVFWESPFSSLKALTVGQCQAPSNRPDATLVFDFLSILFPMVGAPAKRTLALSQAFTKAASAFLHGDGVDKCWHQGLFGFIFRCCPRQGSIFPTFGAQDKSKDPAFAKVQAVDTGLRIMVLLLQHLLWHQFRHCRFKNLLGVHLSRSETTDFSTRHLLILLNVELRRPPILCTRGGGGRPSPN